MLVTTSKSLVCGLVAALTLLVSGSAHAAPLTNGGFESGDFSGWTASIDPSWDGVDTLAPQAGRYAAFFGRPGRGVSTISQSLTTLAGSSYTVSFWLKNEADPLGNAVPNSFQFDWGGAEVLELADASDFDYTKYEFVLAATASTTDLSFSFFHEAAFWDFDSVDVQLVPAQVPEPDSLALAGLSGALALLISSRRPRKFGAPRTGRAT